jgi:hypothetical protein
MEGIVFWGGFVEARRIAREDQASIRRTGSHRDAMFIAETKKDAEASFFR